VDAAADRTSWRADERRQPRRRRLRPGAVTEAGRTDWESIQPGSRTWQRHRPPTNLSNKPHATHDHLTSTHRLFVTARDLLGASGVKYVPA